MENVDWAALPFNYHKTDYNVRISYKDGKWGEPELTQDEYISVHMSAPCLHYGVESFEGLKAFRGADGKVRLFRPDENGKRFAATARKLCMAELPVETFVEMCRMVVKANERFVPPYGTGATLYLRPLEIGIPGRTPRQTVHGVRLRLACRSLFQGGYQTDSRDRESRL